MRRVEVLLEGLHFWRTGYLLRRLCCLEPKRVKGLRAG